MISITITDKDGKIAVEVVNRESDPVGVRLYNEADADTDIVKKAEEIVALVRER